MKKKLSIKDIWKVLKDAFSGFMDHKIPKLSASLAYYTVFSMGPLLIVIIYLCSIFLKREAVEGTIYEQLVSFVGRDTALQLQEIIKNASLDGKGVGAAILGVIFLLVGATTVFAEIQDSINMIWGLKPKPRKGIWLLVKTRLLSFSIIISLGFILLVSLAVTTIIEGLNTRLAHALSGIEAYPEIAVVVFYIINLLITFFIITVLFGMIFKVLPDAKIRWKDVRAGSMVTALLFMLGKFGISFYITKSQVGSTYGAAGSLVVMLLWVYYSSIILYFGAEFTKSYALNHGSPIHPASYAVTTKEIIVESENATVQEAQGKGGVVGRQ